MPYAINDCQNVARVHRMRSAVTSLLHSSWTVETVVLCVFLFGHCEHLFIREPDEINIAVRRAPEKFHP